MIGIGTHSLPIVQQKAHHPFGESYLVSFQLRRDCTPTGEKRYPINAAGIQQLGRDRHVVNSVGFVQIQELSTINHDELGRRFPQCF